MSFEYDADSRVAPNGENYRWHKILTDDEVSEYELDKYEADVVRAFKSEADRRMAMCQGITDLYLRNEQLRAEIRRLENKIDVLSAEADGC